MAATVKSAVRSISVGSRKSPNGTAKNRKPSGNNDPARERACPSPWARRARASRRSEACDTTLTAPSLRGEPRAAGQRRAAAAIRKSGRDSTTASVVPNPPDEPCNDRHDNEAVRERLRVRPRMHHQRCRRRIPADDPGQRDRERHERHAQRHGRRRSSARRAASGMAGRVSSPGPHAAAAALVEWPAQARSSSRRSCASHV